MRCAAVVFVLFAATRAVGADGWAEFRGPGGAGHAEAGDIPLEWSEARNVKWKTAIPGEGWSSPVVWGDQVWMTSATEEGKSRRAICVERESGKIVHDIEVFRVDQPERRHAFNTYASPTPVIEEGRAYVCFGAVGSACIDTKSGRIVWKNTELTLDHKEGAGSSPILWNDLYILNCDGIDVQYVAALHKADGKLAWKAERSYPLAKKLNDVRKAYSTPTIISVDGREQLVSVGAWRVSAYEPATGKELWWCDHAGYSCAPRPVVGEGMVFISTGYNIAQLWAIRVDGRGDVSRTHVAWKLTQRVPLKPSVIVVEQRIYFVTDTGMLRCIDAKTGQEKWQEKLEGGYSASPVLAAGHVLFCGENGQTTVLKPGDPMTIAGKNRLEGRILATPAIVGDSIYIRTATHLYRIAK